MDFGSCNRPRDMANKKELWLRSSKFYRKPAAVGQATMQKGVARFCCNILSLISICAQQIEIIRPCNFIISVTFT